MIDVLTRLLDDALSMPALFADVATTDPGAALLVAIGGLLVTVAIGVFGGLAIGAGVDALRSPRIGRRHPPAE
ncbi:MAG: hypothetical protein ABEJ86_02895 [Halococcoides sp.]